jgi:hypothetical protein
VEARFEALLATVDEDIFQFRSCDVSKEMQFLKLEDACGFDGIPNIHFCHLPRRDLVHLT